MATNLLSPQDLVNPEGFASKKEPLFKTHDCHLLAKDGDKI